MCLNLPACLHRPCEVLCQVTSVCGEWMKPTPGKPWVGCPSARQWYGYSSNFPIPSKPLELFQMLCEPPPALLFPIKWPWLRSCSAPRRNGSTLAPPSLLKGAFTSCFLILFLERD